VFLFSLIQTGYGLAHFDSQAGSAGQRA